MEQERRYDFSLRWSEEDAAFLATCSSFPDLSAFGSTPEEALAEARVVLEMFIEEYREEGAPLPAPHTCAPYSGQVRLRMPKSLHRSLAERAEREGVSLNTLMVSVLSASGTWPAPQQDPQVVTQRVSGSLQRVGPSTHPLTGRSPRSETPSEISS